MGKRYSFPEAGCRSCEKYHTVGPILCETRYCMGVKSKKGKRFKKSDPKYKAPRWCPKRISPVCRIYGFVGQYAQAADLRHRADIDPRKGTGVYVLPQHYRPRLELALGMNARDFYKAVQCEPVEEVLSAALEYGEIIEIDDGLRPYFFYYYNWSTVIPLSFFSKRLTEKVGQ